MVFCTTYALMLPALTMEDPSAGIKLQNAFCYEDDALSINFYVSGRAVFEDDVDIEMPIAENVVLNVNVLDESDGVYAEYSEYAVKNIGEKDLAQVVAFELEFSYLGHKLDVSKCDVYAEIDAKPVFFTDKIGSTPDRKVYIADASHPMATPSDKENLEPAKAVTVIQGTVANMSELPVVYTDDITNVSTMTVEVKGDTLALTSSETDNIKYNVAYYLKTSVLDFADEQPEPADGIVSYKVTDRRDDPDDWEKFSYLVLNKVKEGTDIRAFQFGRKEEYVQVYKTSTYDFSSAYNAVAVNKLIDNDDYLLSEIITGVDSESLTSNMTELYKTLEAKQKYNYSNKDISFTNFESWASDDRIYLENDDTLVLIYEPVAKTMLNNEATLIDYDVSDGYYQTYDKTTGVETDKKTSQQVNGETAYLRTDKAGINSFGLYDDGAKFAFGEVTSWYDWLELAYLPAYPDGVRLNRSASYVRDIVSGVKVDENGDFSAIFSDGVVAPDIFSQKNDYIPDQMVTEGIRTRFTVADEYIKDNQWIPSICADGADNTAGHEIAFGTKYGKGSIENGYYVSDGNRIVFKDYFTSEVNNVAYDTTKKNTGVFDKVLRGFTVEIVYGEISNLNPDANYIQLLCGVGSDSTQADFSAVVNATDADIKISNDFNLYIVNKQGDANYGKLMLNCVGVNSLVVCDNALEKLQYSTLSISFNDKTNHVRIYINGVEQMNYNLGTSINDKLNFTGFVAGSVTSAKTYKAQIKELRTYSSYYSKDILQSGGLNATEIAQNSKFDGTYSPRVDSGLIAEFDADGYKVSDNKWTASYGNNIDPIDLSGADYMFTRGACVVTGSDRIVIPQGVIDGLNNNLEEYTIEIEFGNIINLPNDYTHFISNSKPENLSKFSLYMLDKSGRFTIGLHGADTNGLISTEKANTTDGQQYTVENLQYSTVSITFKSGKMTLYINGFKVAEKTVTTTTTNFDGLVFGPSQQGAECEFRTMRFYNRALSDMEVVYNSRHDGTYSVAYHDYLPSGSVEGYNDPSIGSVGKTVIGGRSLVFKQTGDTYVLSGVNVSTSKSEDYDIYSDLNNLEYFSRHGIHEEDNGALTNDYWPMDSVKSFGTDGHDIKFGNSLYSINRRRYKGYGVGNALSLDKGETEEPGTQYTAWEKKLMESYQQTDRNTFFTTKYKVEFTLSADYVGPLEYCFIGDDDLWVFLDEDKLVCDIGGIHGAERQVVNLWNYIGDGTEESRYNRTKDETHTLYIFLLERGSRASTNYMEFTIPSITSLNDGDPTGSLTLQKQVKNSSTTQPFEFTISLTDADGVDLEGLEYAKFDANNELVGNPTPIKTGDKVELADGERIFIQFLPVDAIYTIKETNYPGFHASYRINATVINDGNTAKGVVGTRTDVLFINTTGAELPSTGRMSKYHAVIYFVPLAIATAYMCAMPFINRPKRRETSDN